MPEAKLARLSIRIFGDVQGVGFRYSAWHEARSRGIVGWVRNEPYGSVMIVAEGPREVLDDFVSWCKNGPRGGRVDKIEVEWGSATGEFRSFETR